MKHSQNTHVPYQHTVASSVSCAGVALHSGAMVNMVIKPAPVNTGIVFIRRDVDAGQGIVPALFNRVSETTLGTTITNRHGVSVSTIEHVMAAIWGYGIDNAVVELDGPEVPIMDGSSEPFTFLLECTGRQAQGATRRTIELLKEVEVADGASTMRAVPHSHLTLDIGISFPHRMITTQHARYDFAETSFKQALCRARTFGFESDVERMRSAGLALGGSLHNAIVLGEDDILNEGGLRYNDEFVRHKALDCVGDFFLAGGQLCAAITTEKPGHHVNNALLRAIFADPANYRVSGGEEVALPAHIEEEDIAAPYDDETAEQIRAALV